MTSNPANSGLQMLAKILVPMVFMFLGLMITVGAMMAIYLPLVPYVIFTFGAIGWLFSTIEAMIAGPLVALGILSPSGQHELLGKAEPAIMFLFNIFLRPSLMIFGLIAALLLSSVVVGMVNAGFGTVVKNLFDFAGTGEAGGTTAAAFNPLTLVFLLVAYVSIITSALNKCFAAIHMVPERVTRWIGKEGEQYGESEAVGKMEGAVGGAGEKVKGEMQKGEEAAGNRAAKKSSDKEAEKQVDTTGTDAPGDGGGETS